MAAKLVSMKIDRAAQEAKYSEKSVAADAPAYPWGLTLNLDEDALEKLGIDLPDVDTKVMVIAKARVTSVSANQSTGGEKRRSLSLQIEELCLEPGGTTKKAEAMLYGESKE